MIEALTLDQLRVLVTVVDAGSFSAAARRLGRVQSAVSTAVAKLEAQLGLALFDRGTRVPRLRDDGAAVVAAARRVLREVEQLRALSTSLTGGLEAKVSLVVDALYPLGALTELARGFAAAFPTVDLRVDTQTLSAVSVRVLDGRASLGVVSPAGLAPGLVRHPLARVQMIPVVAPGHPLARARRPIATAALQDAVQLVLSEREVAGVPDEAVLSARTWRIADLHTKHALLRAGLGWGNLPEHTARPDLVAKRLVRLRVGAWADDEHKLMLSAVHRDGAPLGPAHRWLLGELAALCRRAVA